MSSMDHMSLDILAGIKRLTGSHAHFWTWARLGDTFSLPTWHRACKLELIARSSIETVEQAYDLALARLGITHTELSLWPEDIRPTSEEVTELLRQVVLLEKGDIDVTSVIALAKVLDKRTRVLAAMWECGMRVTMGRRAPVPPAPESPRGLRGHGPNLLLPMPSLPPIEEALPGQSPTVTP